MRGIGSDDEVREGCDDHKVVARERSSEVE